jgi:hypothetical protein
MTHTLKTLLDVIAAYENGTQKWQQRGKDIVKRYRDERTINSSVRKYNVLWSNVETLKPFVYSSTPKPIVGQRGDTENETARVAAQVLERALVFTIAEDHFGSSMRNARDDYLLPGRGTVWARYVPEFKPAEAQVSENNTDDQPEVDGSEGDEAELGETVEIVAFESAVADYVHWKDFGHDMARTWEEVDIVWRKVALDRAALVKRFGEEIGNAIPLDTKPEADGKKAGDDASKATIYEMWIKSEKRAVWLSKSHTDLLDDREDPLKLDHFFPCPRPAYATLTTDQLIPIPDYAEYQDQAKELDDLTGRIAALTKAIKAAGVYDASVPALEQILNDGLDNKLVPVKNWAGLSEKGGLAAAVELLPMKEIAETLLALYQARDRVKADLYEVSGMSDIIRGNTSPEETATAQKIKSNFATKRLQERQMEVERFVRNTVDLLGNIIAVHFAQETLVAMTGVKLLTADMKAMAQQIAALIQQIQQMQQPAPPQEGQPAPQPNPYMAQAIKSAQSHLQLLQQQSMQMLQQAEMTPDQAAEALSKPTWEEVIALLRDQPRRRFSIDIETDSLVAADDAEVQEQRTQFIQSVTGYLNEAGQIAAADPSSVPLLGELLKFGASSFRVGRDLMECIDEYVDGKVKQSKQPQPPKPDPAMAKVQADAQAKQQQMQLDAQSDAAQQQAEAQRHAAELQQTAQLETLKAHLDQQAQQNQAAIDAHLEQQKAMFAAQMEQFKALLQAKTQIEVAEISAGATLDAAQISAANQGSDDA